MSAGLAADSVAAGGSIAGGSAAAEPEAGDGSGLTELINGRWQATDMAARRTSRGYRIAVRRVGLPCGMERLVLALGPAPGKPTRTPMIGGTPGAVAASV